MTTLPRYPRVRVRLVGEDGFAILGRTRRALQNAGASPKDVAEFIREATGATTTSSSRR